MNSIKKLRNEKKGFTLIEIIVVLVILAILAAIAIPSLIGYIDQAKDKQILTEAREVYTAAQSIASEKYASGDVTDASITSADINNLIGQTLVTGDGSNTDSGDQTFTVTVSTDGKISGMTYTHSGKTATYSNGAFTIAKAS